ncbi:hypothetical protein, partial [Halobellus rufus]|uniref:hypothetical protein n=1 Tax=Halobellus rufus TaxID=1448860 RepID=UPI0006795BA7
QSASEERIVGYIIQRVAEVDSNVDGIEVTSIDSDRNIEQLSEAYISALRVADVFGQEYEMEIGSDIERVSDIAKIFESVYDEEGPPDEEDSSEENNDS